MGEAWVWVPWCWVSMRYARRIADAGFEQPMGDTNVAILFGDMALLTAFAFAAGYAAVDSRLPRLGPKLMALGVLAGFTACFLSGARGAWLAIPVLLILFLSCRHLLRPRAVLVGGVVIFLLFGALYLVPQTHVRARLDNALQQFRTYMVCTQEPADVARPPVPGRCYVAESMGRCRHRQHRQQAQDRDRDRPGNTGLDSSSTMAASRPLCCVLRIRALTPLAVSAPFGAWWPWRFGGPSLHVRR